MKSRGSSLNPHAVSYIPLSKRVVDSNTGTPGGATRITECSINFAQGHDERKAWLGSNVHETVDFSIGGKYALQNHHAQGSSSQHPATLPDNLMADEMYDMNIEYLQMAFPGLSHQSLADVYIANKGDMEASLDMLHDLEFNQYESPENLPDTLDIGDVAETVPATKQGTLKLKNVAGEGADASSSTSHPSSLN
ncbi:polyadenylate-binding protein-interacting protein 5-like [Punica granatum]|uniref:Uncharacterized protein n=2 Tax=Punica granatum TaxID=22663 RepID=A0A218W199_PUNGR|nr:polyadenylate-binding protein-interacting protein 5-like [Punica granatum]OWM66614.1 hypothetical protein CDL15_Pgr005051 [Punica granatum]PKI48644.1 hypothetical protein CRG98_030972 [Punica granatum]